MCPAHIAVMKRVIAAFCLFAMPALAETPAPPVGDVDRGLSLMEQGAQLLFQHMMKQVEPSLQDMTDALKQAQPKIMDLMAMMGDIQNFHAPMVLPNGDILIRRKTPAELKLQELQGNETEL